MIEAGNSRRALIYPAQNVSAGKISVFLGRRIADVSRLRTLRAVDDLKFDLLSFFQRSKSVTTNCGVVHKNVTTPFTFNKSITLSVIEPLDLTCNATHTFSFYLLRMLARSQLAKSRKNPEARKSTEPLALCQAVLHFFGLLSIFTTINPWSTT